ncbi:hypothetical protein MNV49_006482 [Pseudohyphozyma bogoriensis]|nr:hypothetical protein MNV49_006482 [Pseudohyphozyma bogoriensis]
MLVLVAVFGSLVLLVLAGLVIRFVRDRKAFWFFRILEAREHRYIAPHAVVAWSTAFFLECALSIGVIYNELRFYENGLGPTVFLLPSITWCFAWITLWLVTWSTIVSHLVQRQLEGHPTSVFASPVFVNTLGLLSPIAFLATIIPLTIRPYLAAVSGFSTFGQTQNYIKASLDKFMQLLYVYDAWTLVIIGTFDTIGIVRLRAIHLHLKKMSAFSQHSGSALGSGGAKSATFTTRPQQGNLRRAWWSLLGMIVLLSGSATAFIAISLWGAITNNPQKIGEQFALTLLYTVAILGLPISIILVHMALRSKANRGATAPTTSFGFKTAPAVRHGIHVVTERATAVEIDLSDAELKSNYQSYPLEELGSRMGDEKA